MATLSWGPYRRRTSEPNCNNQSDVSIQVDSQSEASIRVDSQSEVSIQVDNQSEASITSPVLSLTLRKLSAVADSRLWRLLELRILDPTVSMLRSAPDTRPVSPPGQLLTSAVCRPGQSFVALASLLEKVFLNNTYCQDEWRWRILSYL